METGYREFLFQTLYMLINKPIEEYDILFGKISKLYDEYLLSDIYHNSVMSEYGAMHHFLITKRDVSLKEKL